jgi:hypothetical protein
MYRFPGLARNIQPLAAAFGKTRQQRTGRWPGPIDDIARCSGFILRPGYGCCCPPRHRRSCVGRRGHCRGQWCHWSHWIDGCSSRCRQFGFLQTRQCFRAIGQFAALGRTLDRHLALHGGQRRRGCFSNGPLPADDHRQRHGDRLGHGLHSLVTGCGRSHTQCLPHGDPIRIRQAIPGSQITVRLAMFEGDADQCVAFLHDISLTIASHINHRRRGRTH